MVPGLVLPVALAMTVFLSLVVGFPQARAQTPNEDEAAVLALINEYRAQNGLATLKVSPTLSAAARWMSEDMAERNFVPPNHVDSLGRDPGERMADFGYPFGQSGAHWWAENIAGGQSTPEQVFSAWRGSTGHNANMLNSRSVAAGVGQAYDSQSRYRWYWTVDFGDYDDSGSGWPTPTPTRTSTPSPSPSPTPTPASSPTATPSSTSTVAAGQVVGCPPAGRWSLAVWSGGSDTLTAEALAACGSVPVEAAYWLDPETQVWLRYFAGHPELSSLQTLDNFQGILALGAQPAPAP